MERERPRQEVWLFFLCTVLYESDLFNLLLFKKSSTFLFHRYNDCFGGQESNIYLCNTNNTNCFLQSHIQQPWAMKSQADIFSHLNQFPLEILLLPPYSLFSFVYSLKASLTYAEAQMKIDSATLKDDITMSLRGLNRLAKILKKRRREKG